MPDEPDNLGLTVADFDRPLLLTARRDRANYIARKVGKATLLAITAGSVIAVLLIFGFIVKEAWPFLAERGLKEFLGSTQWYPERPVPEFGALTLIAGSAYVTIGALLIAVPVGILVAVFMSDMVSATIRDLTKPVIELLAAMPSVAYGFFALMVASPYLQQHWGLTTGSNALNAALVLAVMAIPTIVSVSEDALSAVGRELREASYALGATRAETVVKVVIPAAHSGIIAAVILGLMRAVGETMVVWMASGNATHIPSPWWDLSQSMRTMTATIAGEMGETAKGSVHYRALFVVGLVLLVFTFVLNIATEFFLRQVRRAGGGK